MSRGPMSRAVRALVSARASGSIGPPEILLQLARLRRDHPRGNFILNVHLAMLAATNGIEDAQRIRAEFDAMAKAAVGGES